MKNECPYCKGFKVQFADPNGKKLIKCEKCKGTGKYWEKEFESNLTYHKQQIEINKTYLQDLLFEIGLLNTKVKIKARKGCIQIERIK